MLSCHAKLGVNSRDIAMKADHSLWTSAVQVLSGWLIFNSIQNTLHFCCGERIKRMGAKVGKGESRESLK